MNNNVSDKQLEIPAWTYDSVHCHYSQELGLTAILPRATVNILCCLLGRSALGK